MGAGERAQGDVGGHQALLQGEFGAEEVRREEIEGENKIKQGEKMSDNTKAAWRYEASLLRVIDGDTVDAMIDLGFSTHRKVRIRFYGINTPETRTKDAEEKKAGKKATARLIELLQASDNSFILKSWGIGKFGRCLGELFTEELGEVSVNQTLLDEGLGEPYFGGSR